MYYATIANIYFDRPRIPCEIETIFRSAISRRRPMNEYSRNERARVTKSLEREREGGGGKWLISGVEW